MAQILSFGDVWVSHNTGSEAISLGLQDRRRYEECRTAEKRPEADRSDRNAEQIAPAGMRSGSARHDRDHRQCQRHKGRKCHEQEDLTPFQLVRAEPDRTVGEGGPDR